MDVDIQGQRMLLVNVYAPCIDKPNDQVEFWNKMTSLILDFENLDERLILCGGDINFLMNIGLDRAGGGVIHVIMRMLLVLFRISLTHLTWLIFGG